MSTGAEDDDVEFQTVGMDATELDRYAEVDLEGGDVVIYDRDNEDAWIQSRAAVGLDSMA